MSKISAGEGAVQKLREGERGAAGSGGNLSEHPTHQAARAGVLVGEDQDPHQPVLAGRDGGPHFAGHEQRADRLAGVEIVDGRDDPQQSVVVVSERPTAAAARNAGEDPAQQRAEKAKGADGGHRAKQGSAGQDRHDHSVPPGDYVSQSLGRMVRPPDG
jgi:hypothetical protein